MTAIFLSSYTESKAQTLRVALVELVAYLLQVNFDLDLLGTEVYENPEIMYIKAADIVKQLAYKKEKAYQIVKQSFNNIWERIKTIDKSLNSNLPVYLVGDLAYLYEDFVPKNRKIKAKAFDMITTQFKYTKKLLLDKIKNIN